MPHCYHSDLSNRSTAKLCLTSAFEAGMTNQLSVTWWCCVLRRTCFKNDTRKQRILDSTKTGLRMKLERWRKTMQFPTSVEKRNWILTYKPLPWNRQSVDIKGCHTGWNLLMRHDAALNTYLKKAKSMGLTSKNLWNWPLHYTKGKGEPIPPHGVWYPDGYRPAAGYLLPAHENWQSDMGASTGDAGSLPGFGVHVYTIGSATSCPSTISSAEVFIQIQIVLRFIITGQLFPLILVTVVYVIMCMWYVNSITLIGMYCIGGLWRDVVCLLCVCAHFAWWYAWTRWTDLNSLPLSYFGVQDDGNHQHHRAEITLKKYKRGCFLLDAISGLPFLSFQHSCYYLLI